MCTKKGATQKGRQNEDAQESQLLNTFPKLDVLTELIQLVDWANSRGDPTEDKVQLKEKFRSGYLLLEELQMCWANSQLEARGVLQENQNLKEKLKKLDDLVQALRGKLEQKQNAPPETIESVWGTVNRLQCHFWTLVGEAEKRKWELSPVLNNLEDFKREMNELFYQVQTKLRKWEGIRGQVENELEGTQRIVQKLENLLNRNGKEMEEVVRDSKSSHHPPLPSARKEMPPLLPLESVSSTHVPRNSVVRCPVPPVITTDELSTRFSMSNMRSVITHTQHVQQNAESPRKAVLPVYPLAPSQTEPETVSNGVEQVSPFSQIPCPSDNEVMPTPVPVKVPYTTVTAIPPSHVYKMIHPGLPQSQDVPDQAAVIIEGPEQKIPEVAGAVLIEPPRKELPKAQICQQNVCGVCRMNFNTLVQLKLHHSVVHTKQSSGPMAPPANVVHPTQTQRNSRLPHPALRPSHQIASILQLESHFLPSNSQILAFSQTTHPVVYGSNQKRFCPGFSLPTSSTSTNVSLSVSSGDSSTSSSPSVLSPSAASTLTSPGDSQPLFGMLNVYPHERKY